MHFCLPCAVGAFDGISLWVGFALALKVCRLKRASWLTGTRAKPIGLINKTRTVEGERAVRGGREDRWHVGAVWHLVGWDLPSTH